MGSEGAEYLYFNLQSPSKSNYLGKEDECA